jgi:hypothetical protein
VYCHHDGELVGDWLDPAAFVGFSWVVQAGQGKYMA